MEMKLFVKDWLYRHSPAFRPNDHEFLEKLEEYRKELFKKTVEAARAGPRKQETADKSTFTKKFEEPNLNTTFDFKSLFKRNEEKAKGDKYIPVVVTELVKAEQKKKVSFSENEQKKEEVQKTDEVPNEEVEEAEVFEVEEKKEEIKEIKEEKKKKVKKESFIWFSHVRRLRSILKLLFEHQTDGLSEFTKFLKRHRINHNRSKDETAEKFIVEHLLSLESDLTRLLDMSKHLMYSRKQKNLKIRRRIVELSDSVLANLESCLKRKASGVWLDPKNLFFKLQRIEMLYTHLYNDESVKILTDSPRVTIRRKMFKKHKIENEEKLTSPRNLLQCNSDLIHVTNLLPEVPGKCPSVTLVESVSLSNVRYKETSERLMIEIETLIFKKLSLLNEIDKGLENRKNVGSDLDLSMNDENDVRSIIGTCDSVDFTKDKRLGLKIEDVTKPDFNERLLKVEDSLIVTSKRLQMPLKYHDLHPRVKTPYDSTIDLPVQLSRTCARFDFFESEQSEVCLPPPPKIEHKKETKKITKKKPKSVQIRWIP